MSVFKNVFGRVDGKKRRENEEGNVFGGCLVVG